MRWPAALVGVASLLFLTAFLRAQTQDPAAANRPPYDRSSSNTYVGSQACESCHKLAYDTWRRTLHVQMTKPIAEARVEGDFATRLEAYGRTYSMETRDGRYFISISRNKRPAEKFEVHYTLGARRFQGYLSKLPDG